MDSKNQMQKREIKFRAWHKETKQMLNIYPYQWQKGIYQSTGAEHLFFDNKFQFSDDNKECNRIEGKSVFISLDGTIVGLLPIDELTTRSIGYSEEYEIMQYTGLKDKSGKEIYEGDIDDMGRVVKWNEFHCGFAWFDKNGYCKELLADEYDKMGRTLKPWQSLREITGNIYNNPELLTIK